GHRKLLLSDVMRMARERNFPRVNLQQLEAHAQKSAVAVADQFDGHYADFVQALKRGDDLQVRISLHDAFRLGLSIAELADRMVAPALRYIGEEWRDGLMEVHHEHRAVQMCQASLYELKAVLRLNNRPGGTRPRALGGAPSHDDYCLPTLLAHMVMLDCGWEAINLGPNTPITSFRKAVDEYQPKLVWISASDLIDPLEFVDEFNAFADDLVGGETTVVCGGRAITPELRRLLRGANFGDRLTDLAETAQRLHRKPEVPRRGRPRGSKKINPVDPAP
ncbi:MAG: cobalamin B12-binding domain-containing protein, partial [Planctomycetia bacterium]